MSRRGFSAVAGFLEASQWGSLEVNFESVGLEGLKGVSWRNVNAVFKTSGRTKSLAFLEGRWEIKKVEIIAEDWSLDHFTLRIKGIRFSTDTEHPLLTRLRMNHEDWFFDARLPQGLPVFLGDLSRRNWKVLVRDFLGNGALPFPVELFGRMSFMVDGEKNRLRVGLLRSGGGSVFFVDPDDLKYLTDQIDDEDPVYDDEIAVMASYPWRAFRVFEMMREVKTKSDAYLKNSTLSPGFIRHVLLSYRLTQAFGPEFAEKLMRSRAKGEPGARQVELKCDALTEKIGRQYALKGYSEEAMLKRLPEEAV